MWRSSNRRYGEFEACPLDGRWNYGKLSCGIATYLKWLFWNLKNSKWSSMEMELEGMTCKLSTGKDQKVSDTGNILWVNFAWKPVFYQSVML